MKTEPIYLKHWFRLHREKVIVKIDDRHGTPMYLSRAAVDQRASDISEAERGRGDPFNEYWCVFDVDDHPQLPRALQLASAKGISVALSNPCVERWFLLHFEDRTASLDRREAQRRAREHLHCGKAPDSAALDLLVEHHDDARNRAEALDVKHAGDGSPRHSNPSSTAWQLVDTIRGASA